MPRTDIDTSLSVIDRGILYGMYGLFVIGGAVALAAAARFASFAKLTSRDFVRRLHEQLGVMLDTKYLAYFVVLNGFCIPVHFTLLYVVDRAGTKWWRRLLKAVLLQSLVYAASFLILMVIL